MEIQSPAKINLFLEICNKRPDGYHNLNTLMCCISLHDIVRLTFGQKKISVHCTHPDVPENETNLAWRAARLFFDTARIDEGVRIDIEKNIPIGAGLGGGSSNAAAVLVALNRITKALAERELLTIAPKIGADVPFFIRSQTAIMEGVGEKITGLRDFPTFHYVILCPNIHTSTEIGRASCRERV